MKRIIFLLLPFLPYLASAQVAKDTVTVLTIAQIPAGAIRDTTNFTFVQDNAFKKATFDSLYKYTRVKLLAAGAITSAELANALSNETGTGAAVFATNPTITLGAATGLPLSTGVTGQLPVGNGGTGQSTLAANKVLVGNGTGGVLQPTNLHWDNTNSRLGIGTNSPALPLDVRGIAIGLTGATNTFVLFAGGVYSSVASHATYFQSSRARGTEASPQAVQDGDLTFSLAAQPYNGTTFVQNAGIFFEVDGALNGTNIPSRIRFNTHSTTGYFERMRITSAGETWIGYTTDQGNYRLQVADSVYVGGNVSAAAYTTRSDYELKENIRDVGYGIQEVMQLQPVKYTYKSNGAEQLGFIAQDLGVVLPEVVSFEDNMAVFYSSIIPVLTKAIQEQQQQIEQLKQRITQLENK